MVRIPEIVVRPVKAPQDLLPCLRRQVADPVEIRTGGRQMPTLLRGTQGVPALLPQIHTLFQSHIPQSTHRMTPPDQDLALDHVGVRTIFAPRVCLHTPIVPMIYG